MSAIVASTASAGGCSSSPPPPSPSSPPSPGSAPDGAGVGSPSTKSVEFSPVAATRETEVALSVPGAGASPEKVSAAPQPTRSTTAGSSVQVVPWQVSFPSASERANTPPLPEALIPPSRSGAGRGSPLPLPSARPMRKVPPAGTVPDSVRVLLNVPVREAYWRLQPSDRKSGVEGAGADG